MAEVEVKSCSNPGCDQPGTSSCSACKTTVYCCVICQTADWSHHKEECQGHLRKVGKANLARASAQRLQDNYAQTLHYAEVAATKLKLLKDRRLETVQLINAALGLKFDALNFMDRYREAMDCIKECYTLWAMNQMRNPGSIKAALGLIQSCILNNEYEDAEHYARHAMFMINDMTDNFIPSEQRPLFLADGSYYLAVAIYWLAVSRGIPAEEKQKAGQEAIALARQALEIHTQLHGTESAAVLNDMRVLADSLDYFNDVDDDEVLRLYQQSITIISRMDGSSSLSVAEGESNLGIAYEGRALRAYVANDMDRCVANLELALSHYREAAPIYRANNRMDKDESYLRRIAAVEERIRLFGATRAAATQG